MLFFHSSPDEKTIILNPDESRHAVKVLRLNKGDSIQITDGKGSIYQANIIQPDARKCLVEIIDQKRYPSDPYRIHIAISPTKNIERTQWFVEKAIEIGIHEISFPICNRSERKVLNVDKIHAKAVSAIKQSLTPFLPKINDPTSFEKLTKNNYDGDKFIAHLENENTPELLSKIEKDRSYTILIGPEGDFDDNELSLARKAGFIMVKLGNKRLRTETAALHACSLLNGLNYQ